VIEGLVTTPVKLPEPVSVSCAAPSATFVTDALPDGVYVASAGIGIKLIVYGEPSGGKNKLFVRSLVVPLCVNFQVVTVNVAGVTVIEGLVTTPVKLPEPVSVSCAAGSETFVTDAVPDCVCDACKGVIIFGLIVYVF
jgi:hypothetical protein